METSKAIGVALLSLAVIVFAIFLMFTISSFYSDKTAETKTTDSAEAIEDWTGFSQIPETILNCPESDGSDFDGDGVADECDNCPDDYNSDQYDRDYDGLGDVCDFVNNRKGGSGGDDDDDDEEITCSSNSDCGTDSFIGNKTCSDSNVVQTYKSFTCINPNKEDSTCSSKTETKIIEACQFGCSEGKCAAPPIKCSSNSDCNDNNASTEDVCHNAGQAASYCTNEKITCFANSDCGLDGFIDGKSCSNLDVTQVYKTFTCTNPGKAASACSSQQETKVIQTCSDVCVLGECKDIACYSDSECGLTGFIGEPFCFFNSIFKNYQTSKCIAAGLPSSLCSITSTNQSTFECQYACTGGACIRCDSDEDCDDNDLNTEDKCILPGTALSDCTHTPIIICTNQCADSERKCSNNGFQICHDYNGDGCTEWSGVTQCSTGQTCENGFCQTTPPVCTDECTNGERKCSNNGFQICHDYNGDGCTEWSGTTGCSYNQVCIAGFCI
jgi:hypothetical protein